MPTTPHTTWNFTAVFGALAGLIVGLVALAFLWPVATASPSGLPVAVGGSPTAVSKVQAGIKTAEKPLDLIPVADRAAAVNAIEQRDVYGAIILGEEPEVLVASGASPVAAQILRAVAEQLPTTSGGSATVIDLVPLSSDDASGAGLTAAAFPVVLGGMIGGILISLLVAGVARRLTALVIYGFIGGSVVTLVMHTGFGIVQGSFWLDALALGLTMLATSSLIVGCNALIGPAGIGIGAVTTMFIANPISGASQPREFMTGPWGDIGQFFVPGAGNSLIRQISYFPDASAAREWLVLAAWATVGLALSTLGHFRNRAPIPLPAFELERDEACAG